MTTENLYTDGCIRTFTGKYVNVFDPQPEMFCIEDVAHALSNQPRFGGHLPVFYCVATHCISVAKECVEYKFTGLMHDAAEAYLIDLPNPIKKKIPQYNELEHNLNLVLSKVFGFIYPFPDEVKKAGIKRLEFEWHNIMLGDNPDAFSWSSLISQKGEFIHKYHTLKKTFK